MGKVAILFSFAFLAFAACAFSKSILFVFSGANFSHKMGIWPLVIALANRGHQITFISSIQKQPIKHPNVTDLAPSGLQDFSDELYGTNRMEARNNYAERKLRDEYHVETFEVCKLMLNVPELKPIYNSAFDLVVINAFFGECGFLIAHYLGSKYIIYTPTVMSPWFSGTFGLPNEVSWIPDIVSSYTQTYPMGLFDRMMNLYDYFHSTRETVFSDKMVALMKKEFNVSNTPSFIEMEKNASLIFINSHHTIDFARSLPPLFVSIGGMSSWEPTGKLPQEFEDFMNSAEEGVILITFGSTMDLSLLPEKYRNMFFNTMRQLHKTRFIWRWSEKLPENQPRNLMASKWLPQREILEHPKVKAFVTHCGISGIIEATYFGVPLIGIPFFADQDFSAYRIVAQKLGVLLEIREMTQDSVTRAFEEILNNPKYANNMKARSKMFRDRPQNPTEIAVYWTEFVLRHDDTSSLKPLAMEQPMLVRSNFDVYLVAILIFIAFPLMLSVSLMIFSRHIAKLYKNSKI